jgi:hypothetical protein
MLHPSFARARIAEDATLTRMGAMLFGVQHASQSSMSDAKTVVENGSGASSRPEARTSGLGSGAARTFSSLGIAMSAASVGTAD